MATKIQESRFRRDFEHLSRIGATGDGGVHRPTFSEAHLEAREWLRRRLIDDGWTPLTDAAGNISARLASPLATAPTVLLGSHVDSVPRGGRFDGALGVIAALEALCTLRDSGIELPVHWEVIDFTDEEGSFLSLLGSRALTGALERQELEAPRGALADFDAGLLRAGLSRETLLDARRPSTKLAGFFELHIEQGPRLVEAAADIGVVSSIVGIDSGVVTFTGRADHAGTTPMLARRDAGKAAAAFMHQAMDSVIQQHGESVLNIGAVQLSPGAYNIVPELAQVSIEFRSGDARELEALRERLVDTAQSAARHAQVSVAFAWEPTVAPVACAADVQTAFQRAAEARGLSWKSLASGAGHDTMALARVCPAGMIFVPSQHGSHSPREHCEWSDCVHGAQVLFDAALSYSRAQNP